jgi:hypothetical protein
VSLVPFNLKILSNDSMFSESNMARLLMYYSFFTFYYFSHIIILFSHFNFRLVTQASQKSPYLRVATLQFIMLVVYICKIFYFCKQYQQKYLFITTNALFQYRIINCIIIDSVTNFKYLIYMLF